MIDTLISILVSGTPLIYVTLAGVLAQRAGVWNLGLEGLMIIGSCALIVGIVQTGSFLMAILIAAALCVAASVLLWFVVERLQANPIIAGLGLTGLGLGGTSLAIQALYDSEATVTASFGVPKLNSFFSADLGQLGGLSVFVLLMPVMVWLVWFLLERTRLGLQISASGEHPFAARSVGVSPSRMRLLALSIGGVLCAIGGAELAGGNLQIFSQNMTAGRGFMAFAAVIFGAGSALGATAAALFFAIVAALGIRAQLLYGGAISNDFLQALPYLATVFGVWLSTKLRGGLNSIRGTAEMRE